MPEDRLRIRAPDGQQATLPFSLLFDVPGYADRAAGSATLLLALEEPLALDRPASVRDAFGEKAQEVAGFDRFVQATVLREDPTHDR